MDQMINQSVDPMELLLANPMLDKDRRAHLISNCSKTITQYKFDLMSLNLDIIQNLKRGYEQKLVELQNQISQHSHENTKSNNNETLEETIRNRQELMRKRHDIYLKHKLNTFFDEAPMVTLNK